MKQGPEKPGLPQSLLSSCAAGEAAAAEIQNVANYLAELMREFHGCEYSIQIDHTVRFILIAGKSR